MEWTLEKTGQLGDTVGGWANVGTLLVGLSTLGLLAYSVWWARGEADRFRAQQRRLINADSAKEIFRLAFRFGRLLRHAIEMTRGEHAWSMLRHRNALQMSWSSDGFAPAPRQEPGPWEVILDALSESEHAFQDSLADTQMFFGRESAVPLAALLETRVVFNARLREFEGRGSAGEAAELQPVFDELHARVARELEAIEGMLSPHATLK